MKTIIEIATSQVVGATYSNECLETQTLIDELLQVVMVKPFFDFETREFYEGATPEEIEQLKNEVDTFLQNDMGVDIDKINAFLPSKNILSNVLALSK